MHSLRAASADALHPTLGVLRQAARVLSYATPWNKEEGSSMQLAILRIEEVNGQWGSNKQGQCPHLPGRPMPIFSRSSFLTYSKWDSRVTLRSSRSRRKYCCSCTSDSSSSSQPVPSSGCMLLLPSRCGEGRMAQGPRSMGRWQGTLPRVPEAHPYPTKLLQGKDSNHVLASQNSCTEWPILLCPSSCQQQG